MKRFVASALLIALTSSFGLVGCGEESSVKKEETVTTPDGEAKKTTETTLETKGNPPVTTPGETVEPPK